MSNGSGCFLHFPLDLLGAEVTDASGMGVVYLSIGMEFPFLYLLGPPAGTLPGTGRHAIPDGSPLPR